MLSVLDEPDPSEAFVRPELAVSTLM